MTKINCIAIEDEPQALQLLEHYADQIPFLNWVGGFRQPLEALPLLNSKQVDLLFLDINLAQLNGLEFYRSLVQKPMVIFTTAYSEHAVESYSLQAVDYLVKPFQFERFVQACNKALKQSPSTETEIDSIKSNEQEVIYLKSGTKWFQLHWADILYLEKSENYIIFHTADGRKILTRQNMQDIETIVPSFFCRTHKSFIVNIKRIDIIERENITIKDKSIPLADSYRDVFMKKCGLVE